MEQEKIDNFRKLKAWQRDHELLLAIYRSSQAFPSEERHGLTSQIKRAVLSITSNIAEGFSRQSKPDKTHFYQMALGSCSEVQNQIIAAYDLGFINQNEYEKLDSLSEETHKIINGLIKSIRTA